MKAIEDRIMMFLILWDHLKKRGEIRILRRAIELYYGIEDTEGFIKFRLNPLAGSNI